MGVWVSPTPRPHFTPKERPCTHFTGGFVGPRAGLHGRKISSPPGFDPGPFSPVVSRYTDWATGPTSWISTSIKKFFCRSYRWLLSAVSHFKQYRQGKVKCTLVQALRLCIGRTAHRGNRGIALLFLDRDTRRGWGFSVTPRPLFTPRKDSVPIAQEAGWAPGPVWTGAENLASTGIRSPNRPARSQSLYRLSYLVNLNNIGSA